MNIHSVYGKIKRQEGGTKATERPRKGSSLGVKTGHAGFTAYSLGIISETSSRDYINYEGDSQEKALLIKSKQSL